MSGTFPISPSISHSGPVSSYLDVISSTSYDSLSQPALAYAAAHGITMRARNNTEGHLVHAPCTIIPTPLDRGSFEKAIEFAPYYNILVDAIARHPTWLESTLEIASQVDDFVKRLLHIRSVVKKEGIKQPISLGLHRSDYMIHVDEEKKTKSPMQIEINTIAASFASLSTHVSEMHRHIITRHLHAAGLSQHPENHALTRMADALAAAVKHYPNPSSEPLYIAMIIQPNEHNESCQRLLEHQIWNAHKIPLIRVTMKQVKEYGSIREKDGALIISGHTIAVTYFRACYVPKDLPTEDEWDALLMVERSFSIKAPSVHYHLAGTKKVQQQLAMKGELEKFVSPEVASLLRSGWVGLWGLEKDDDETRAIIAQALSDPDEYVLKPQREGGGNNLWHDELIHALKTFSVAERSAYILMKRIRPASQRAILARNGQYQVGEALSELGIYASILSDGQTIFLNNYCGYLLRTKLTGVDEGGVASGFAVLDSPLLTPSHSISSHL